MLHMVPTARSHDVVVRRGSSAHRLAKIIFARDGSFYVTFPGLDGVPGLVAAASIVPERDGSSKTNLAQIGLTTSHMVKFAYHPDGAVHFSQDGKVRTEVKLRSESLSTKTGHLFTVHLTGIERLRQLPPGRPERGVIEFLQPTPVPWATMICTRHKMIASSASRREFLARKYAGIEDSSGVRLHGTFIAAPDAYQLNDFALFLRFEARTPFATHDQAALGFAGGFVCNPTKDDPPYRMLVALYPCDDHDRMRQLLGTIDRA